MLKQNESIHFLDGFTFDDILLAPGYSEVLPHEVDTASYLTREIKLKTPIISAAMDTVSEVDMAISMAQVGALGVIHRNMSIEEQAAMVENVKRSENGIISDPVTVSPHDPISEVLNLMSQFKISGLPVVDGKELVGIITNRDIRFYNNEKLVVKNLMTSGRDKLVTISEDMDLEDAKKLMHRYRIEKILKVNDNYELQGLITIKDINKTWEFPNASKDSNGRLLAAAAVGTSENELMRCEALIEKKVDLLFLDTAHGNSKAVLNSVKEIKKNWPDIGLIAGNIATPDAVENLDDAGVDGIKIGIGPGSICTTRIISGVGVPQISALLECAKVAKLRSVPIISDGGIKFSGDLVKAIAAGADTVMIGSLLAGTDESPGETVLYQGRRYKSYRGMGSIGAMQKGGGDRYFQKQSGDQEFIPEGIEGRVSYKGPVASIIHQLVGGLKAGMGYTGNKNIRDLQNYRQFIKITSAGFHESHVHDVSITKEAPNYNRE